MALHIARNSKSKPVRALAIGADRGDPVPAVRGMAIAMEMQGLTAQLARFVAASPHALYPPEALHAAKRAFIDTLGVMQAGRNEQGISYLNRALRLFTEMRAQREIGDIRERLEAVEDLYLPAVHQWSAELMASAGQDNVAHASRVADFSCRLGEILGLEGWELTVLRVGALLHDIGYTALFGCTEGRVQLAPDAHPLLKVHAIAGDAIARRRALSAVRRGRPTRSAAAARSDSRALVDTRVCT